MKIILLLILFYSVEIFSQRYQISGSVKDSAGIPLSGVNIFVTETDFGTASDAEGNYILSNLRPGKYTLQFSMVGYKRVIFEAINLSGSVEQNIIMVPQPVESKEVIITAGKHQQLKEDLSVSAEIMSGETFTPRNYTTLEDAVRYIPGVVMVDDQMSIRGSTGYSKGAGTRVLLAVDGIPMYQGDTGEIVWESIPVGEIDRIELLKGAASSLYGSTAIGGVINVITKRVRTESATYVSAFYGVYDKPTYEEWDWSGEYRQFNGYTLAHSNNIDKLGFTLSFTRQQSNGYRQDGFNTKYIGFLKTIYSLSPSSTLSLFVNTLNQRSGSFIYWKDSRNTLIQPDTEQGQTVASDRYMFGFIYKQVLSSSFFFNFRSGYYRTNWEEKSSSSRSSLSNVFRNEIQTNLSLSASALLISGIENSLGNTTANIFGDRSSFGAGIYSQLEYKFSFPLSLTAGIRYDYNIIDSLNASGAVSPKAGVNYKLTEKLILRSSIGQGFRAPSIAETFTTTNISGIPVFGNPDLKAEKSLSFEAGALYKINDNITFDAALFNNEFYDFIEPEADESGNISFGNITRARIQGVEFNQDYYFFRSKLNLFAGFTYLWARDLNTGKALKYRPRHVVFINLNYELGNIETGLAFRYSSRVMEIDDNLTKVIIDGENRVDIYVLDFSLGYNLFSHGIPGKIFLNTKNLLNYYYVELVGNLAPLRNYSINAELFF